MTFRTLLTIAFLAITIATLALPAAAQEGNTDEALTERGDQLYVEVNRALIAEGLRPLGRDATLDDVAQTIADELSATGEYVSLPRILADQLGYPRWPDGGQRVISEAVNLIGIETPAEFAATWREPLTEILLNTFYREIGVGVATRIAVEGGTEQNVYVVILGAQPNVLPVIINDGAPTVYNQQIELYIQNEQSLAYETSDEIIQFARTIRIANSEAELASAEWLSWEGNNFGVPWQLMDDYGEKHIWVEFEDDKGFRIRSQATVAYENLDSRPAATSPPAAQPTILQMDYDTNTFTLQVDSSFSAVRLQEVYFTWEDERFAYEIELAGDLADVDLEAFDSDACLLIYFGPAPTDTTMPGCETVYPVSFTGFDAPFWSYNTFTVLNGPNLLGTCQGDAGNCQIELQ